MPGDRFISNHSDMPEGIAHPPLDDLLIQNPGLTRFAAALAAAKRARELTRVRTDPYALMEFVGPLVETSPYEKALSIALRELNQGNLIEVVEDDQQHQTPNQTKT